jgi:hypothetical protein
MRTEIMLKVLIMMELFVYLQIDRKGLMASWTDEKRKCILSLLGRRKHEIHELIVKKKKSNFQRKSLDMSSETLLLCYKKDVERSMIPMIMEMEVASFIQELQSVMMLIRDGRAVTTRVLTLRSSSISKAAHPESTQMINRPNLKNQNQRKLMMFL